MSSELMLLGLALVGLAGSALCNGTELGLYSLNRVRLSLRVAQPNPPRPAVLLKRELDRPGRALATLLIANTICGDLGATGLSAALEHMGYSDGAVVVLTALILTPLVFVFTEMVPKEIFRTQADRLTYSLAPVLWLMRWLLTATLVLPTVDLVVRGLTRALGRTSSEASLSPRERLAALLKEGGQGGALSESQATMLDRALALKNTTVGDEARPWTQVVVVSPRWDRGRVLELIRVHAYSRFPVVDLGGRVVGILESVDVAIENRPITALMKPALTLPADTPVSEGLVKLAEADARMAVVMGRGKGPDAARPIGIVTAKDLVEPLTGELAAW
jgi:CBS domain containing-hemolysin-like protein